MFTFRTLDSRQAARLSQLAFRMKLEFPIFHFFAEKKSGEQGKKRPGCLGYISEQWTLGTCNLQDAITLVRAVVTDLERDPNGDSYEGEFKNGKKHGNGKMLWDDGEYEGAWKDLQDGKGIPPTFLSQGTKEKKGSKN